MENTSNRRLLAFWSAAVVVAAGALNSLGSNVLRAQSGDVVSVSFLAVGADGKPVTNLTAEQVSLKLAGKARPLRSLRFVQVSEATAAAASTVAKPFDSLPAAPFGTNAVQPARAVMITVDEESIRPGSERAMKDALAQFIASLPARDRVGLATMPRGTIKVELTTQHATVQEAAAKITGRASGSESSSNAQCRTRDALDAIGSTLAAINSDDPVTLVFFSLNVAVPSRTASSTGSNMCELTTQDYERVAVAASAARAQMYLVMPETISDMTGLQNLAGVTNGYLTNLSTGSENVLARITRETSGYYVGTFDLPPAERTGQGQRLEIKAGDNVTVRSPAQLIFAKADPKASKPSAKDMVKDQKKYSDVPLRVVGFVSRADDPTKAQVLIIAEPVEAGTKFASATIGMFDSAGKGTQWSAVPADLEKAPLLTALLVAPGKYRLRAAVTDAAGRGGAADYDLNAELTPAGPMKLSGLILGVGAGTLEQPKFMFKDEPSVIVYFEIYGANPGKGITAAVELAATEDGPAIVSAQPKLAAPKPDKFTANAVLPIDKLAPGDYVVRAIFAVEGETPGRIVHTLRKGR